MTVIELGIGEGIERHSPEYPFVFRYQVNIKQLAGFWLTTFSVTSEVSSRAVFILSVNVRGSVRLNKTTSYADCVDAHESWYFDITNQTLFMNFGIDYNPILDFSDLQVAVGYSDKKVVYIDDIPAFPILTSAPSIRAKQDMINYDRLAFSSGSVGLDNRSTIADWLTTASILSNDCAVYFLDETAEDEYLRTDLTPIAWYIIEDIKIGQQTGTLKLQDVRKTLNVKLPVSLFNTTDYSNIDDNLVGSPIPLTFGECTVDAICTNGKTSTGAVTYRASYYLQAITTIEVYDDETRDWLTVTPTAKDASIGSFTLSEADGRGTSGNGARDCRVTCTGYSATNPIQVISKLEELGNNVTYTTSFYDTSEIATETATLEGLSLHIDKLTELYELIRRIQEGSSNRFRYEVNAEGLRTIRIDNLDRTPTHTFIPREKISESERLDIYTDKPTVAASVKIIYGTNFTAPRPSVTDTSKQEEVAENIRERPQIEFETYLRLEATAILRAALEAERLGQVRRFTDATLRGYEFLTLRIYDTIIVELKASNRDFSGIWLCQILAVSPDTDSRQNKVTLLLVEKQAELDDGKSLRVTTTGAIRTTATGSTKVRVTK